MKTIGTIFLVITGLLLLVCITSCSAYKEERFRNKLIEDFKLKGFDFNSSKYDALKVGDILVDVHIEYSPYNQSYLIRLGFYSLKNKEVFVEKVFIGNKKILINKKVDLDYRLSNGVFTGDLVDLNHEEIIRVPEKEMISLSESKNLKLKIHFKINNKERHINIIMEQYTARDIVWPT